MRTCLQQHPVKELIIEIAKVEIPLAATPATIKTKKAKKDSETKTISSEPSSQRRSAKKKTKEPSLEIE